MTEGELITVKAALDKASNWARKEFDLSQIIYAKKLVEKELLEKPVNENLNEAAEKAVIKEFPAYEQEDYPLRQEKIERFAKLFKAGAQWQKQQTVNKAVEWLEDVDTRNYEAFDTDSRTYFVDNDKLINDFKQAMEEKK